MASFKILKGLKNNLPSSKSDGTMYYTTDEGIIYVDYQDGNSISRKALNAEAANKLKVARTFQTNLGSTSKTSFDGSENVSMGVTGTLPIGNGGTGATTAAGVLTNLGVTATATELNYCDGVTSNIQTQLNNKMPNYTIEIYNGTSGNPKPVRFASFNYSTCNSENGIAAKIGLVSGHGNGVSYAFLEDAIIKVSHIGDVSVDNFKYYGASTGNYDGANRQYGDIFWLHDTTNKIVDFYVLMGQYARVYQTPWKRLTSSSGGSVTQYTSCTVYSSGTKSWANNSNIALKSDIVASTNTTYTLSKSGNTITLTGNDGSTTSVTDVDTTYSNATTSAAGLMSATDKTNLNNLITEVENVKKSVSDGKTAVANAITNKGVTTATNAEFATMATNIGKISTLSAETADATIAASDVLSGKIGYGKNGAKITGTMANKGAVSATLSANGTYTIPAGYHNGSGKVSQSLTTKAATTYTPGTSNQTIAAGTYLSGAQTIKGDANLIAANIKSGVSIFGVSGNSNVVDTSAGDATAAQILTGKKAYVDGALITGTMTNNGALNSTLAANGTYTIPAGYTSGGKITQSLTTKGATTITPSTSAQTAVASGVYTTGAITVAAMPTATQATPSISVSSSGLITASATQSAGYVSAGTKSATQQLTTKAATTITPSTSAQTAVASGVYTTGAITVAAMPTATQATPSISINSSGLITASATQTAGYVAAGTKSATKQLTTKGATTWTPKTSNQTIAAGTYLTGAQTIKGDSNLKSANIKKGVSIFGVTGTHNPASSATDIQTLMSSFGWTASISAGNIYSPDENWQNPKNYWRITLGGSGTSVTFPGDEFVSYSADTILDTGFWVCGFYTGDGASDGSAILSSVNSQLAAYPNNIIALCNYNKKGPRYGLAMGGFIRASTSRYYLVFFYTDGNGKVPYRALNSSSNYVTLHYQRWI